MGRRPDINTEITRLESPIDVLYLIHKAMRAKASRVEKLAGQLAIGNSLQPFRIVFNSWASFASYHSEQEDIYMTPALTNPQQLCASKADQAEVWKDLADLAALEDELHRELLEQAEEVLKVLNEEINKTSVIYRTKQHLYSQMVALRVTQEDHLETEEALVLPAIRELMSSGRQLELAHHLLIDEEAQDPRWPLDWIVEELTATEQSLVSSLQ